MLPHEEDYSAAKKNGLDQYEPTWAGLEITLLSEKRKLQVMRTGICYLCKQITPNSRCL